HEERVLVLGDVERGGDQLVAVPREKATADEVVEHAAERPAPGRRALARLAVDELAVHGVSCLSSLSKWVAGFTPSRDLIASRVPFSAPTPPRGDSPRERGEPFTSWDVPPALGFLPNRHLPDVMPRRQTRTGATCHCGKHHADRLATKPLVGPLGR